MTAEGYVYFVAGTRCRLIKIGYTEDVKGRLRSLQLMSPDALTLLAIMPGTLADERALHVTFARLRQHGEWFKATIRLRRYISEVLATHDQTVTPRVRPVNARPLPPSPTRPFKRPSRERVAELWGIG